MKTAIIIIISLLVGGLVGGFLALGAGAAGGLVVGTQAGICLAVETGKGSGLLDAAQADKLVSATVDKIHASTEGKLSAEHEWIADEAGCARMVAELKKEVAAQ